MNKIALIALLALITISYTQNPYYDAAEAIIDQIFDTAPDYSGTIIFGYGEEFVNVTVSGQEVVEVEPWFNAPWPDGLPQIAWTYEDELIFMTDSDDGECCKYLWIDWHSNDTRVINNTINELVEDKYGLPQEQLLTGSVPAIKNAVQSAWELNTTHPTQEQFRNATITALAVGLEAIANKWGGLPHNNYTDNGTL